VIVPCQGPHGPVIQHAGPGQGIGPCHADDHVSRVAQATTQLHVASVYVVPIAGIFSLFSSFGLVFLTTRRLSVP
jgi:hypothetical protein